MNRLLILFIITTALSFAACGGNQATQVETTDDDMPKVRMDASDFYHPELVSSEFTDEVDEKRYRAIGNVLDEVSPRARIIYFVGKLRNVPTQAQIKVLWFNDNMAEPVVETDVYGSDAFSFISNFTPPGRRFLPGNYTVRVIVNGEEAGSNTFKILGKDPFAEGVQVVKLKIAKKLNKKGAPIKPDVKFKRAQELHATFKVQNVMSPTELTVRWYRGGSVFNEAVIAVDGNGRFSANIASPAGLPNGTYTVEIEREGATLIEKKFAIGNASLGPVIDHIELGEELGKGSMPKRPSTKFKEGLAAIYAGLRFLDLEPDSEILIEWVLVEDDGESVFHVVKTPIPGGGSGAMSANWAPGNIYAGNYKAVVYINDELATEAEFTVQ